MKEYTQTRFGRGFMTEDAGDCFATALGCILEVPPEQIPDFFGPIEDRKETDECYSHFWDRVDDFLRPFDLHFLEITVPPQGFWQERYLGFHTISGMGPRGCRHCVVGYQGEPIWDPHPTHAGLLPNSGEVLKEGEKSEHWEIGVLCRRFVGGRSGEERRTNE